MERKIRFVYLLFVAATLCFLLISFSSNPPNGRTGAPGESTCSFCHSENNPNGFDGMLSFDGIPASIQPNTTYTITVTSSNPNGMATQAGFQWVALNSNNQNAGFLSSPSAGSTLSAANGRVYHEHNPAKAFLADTEVSWTVDWTSPNVLDDDVITFYGISVFGDGGTNQGDQVAQTQVTAPLTTTLALGIEIMDTTDVSCFGTADGLAIARGINGTAPYSYEWSNGSLDSFAIELSAGIYYVTVTDSANETAVDSIAIESPDSLYIELNSLINIDCNSDFGSAEVEVIGGTPDYTFTWSNGDSTALADSLNAGFYTVVVQDANLCSDTLDIEILSNTTSPSFTFAPTPELNCLNDSVVLQVMTINCDTCRFNWATIDGHIASGTQTAMPIVTEPGTYRVTITDENNGCQSISQQSVMADFELPQVIVGDNDTLTCSTTTLQLNGSAPGCTNCIFTWTTFDGHIVSGEQTSTPVIDAPGSYFLSVLNQDNGCSNIDSLSIFGAGLPNLNLVELEHVSCNGLNNGFASVFTTGGTPPYTYSWSNGGDGAEQANLPPGNYTMTVTDANDCTDNISFSINEPPPIILMTNSTSETAFEANDGTASVAVSGGTPPYEYQWSNDSTSAAIENLPPGFYSIVVSDANGCMEVANVTITPFVCTLETSLDFTTLDCNGDENAQAILAITNELDPLTIQWSNGGEGLVQNNLGAGQYQVSVTDGTGCIVVQSFEIAEPEVLLIELGSFQNIACNGSATGAARVDVSGGNPDYSYLWSNGSNEAFINGVLAGTYTLTVTDANNCQDTFAVTLSQPPFLELNISNTNETAVNANDGTATVEVEGGVPPYQYQWSNGTFEEVAENLAPGQYQVTIFDQNGCNIQGAVIINDFDCPIIFIDSEHTPLICPGSNSGSAAVLEVPGANQPVSYLWSTGSTDTTISNLSGGMYFVTITDATNCAVIDVFDINEGDPNGPTAIAQDITLTLDENGLANLDPAEVDNGSFDNCMLVSMALSQSQFDCSDIGQQSITFTVTDGPGNISIDIITVRVEDNQVPEILNCPSDIVSTDCNEVITYPDLTVIDNCQFNLTRVEGLPSGSIFPAGTTTVLYEAEDDAGNMAACAFEVRVESTLNFTVETTPVSCSGGNDGEIDVMPSGGTPPYTINGIPLNVTAGTYSINVVDNLGCSISQSVMVASPPSIEVSIDSITPAVNNQSNGSVDVTASGGTGALSFFWRDLEGNDLGFEEDITGIPAGTYFVWVTDENDCFIILEVEVDRVTAVQELNSGENIKVFPNPNKGWFFVQTDFPNPVSLICAVYNANGQLMSREVFGYSQQHKHSIDLSHLPSGIYMLQFQMDQKTYYQKVVLSH